jgi:hypothetical protein
VHCSCAHFRYSLVHRRSSGCVNSLTLSRALHSYSDCDTCPVLSKFPVVLIVPGLAVPPVHSFLDGFFAASLACCLPLSHLQRLQQEASNWPKPIVAWLTLCWKARMICVDRCMADIVLESSYDLPLLPIVPPVNQHQLWQQGTTTAAWLCWWQSLLLARIYECICLSLVSTRGTRKLL